MTIRNTHKEAINRAAELIKTIPFSKTTGKLTAISALSHSTIKKVSEVFNVTDDSIKSWLRAFDKKGLDGLKSKVKNPAKPKLNSDQKDQIELWLKKNPNLTMNAIRLKIADQFGVNMTLVGVWKNVKAMNLAHITARSVHYKQDKEKLEEFKKNTNQNKRKKSK